MSLLLIRHGETDGNASRVIQHPKTALNNRGVMQATRVANKLARREDIKAILTSDYKRARETALKISETTGIDFSINPLLRERNFGDLRGNSYDEIGDVNVFAENYTPPNGENWTDFHRRVDSAWEEIKKRKKEIKGTLVVVTHGLFIRSLIERILKIPDGLALPELVVGNTSVTSVTSSPPWKITELAAVDHLNQEVAAKGIV